MSSKRDTNARIPFSTVAVETRLDRNMNRQRRPAFWPLVAEQVAILGRMLKAVMSSMDDTRIDC